MALQIKTKKGGPYTKQEQEKRRKQVYELHFEKGSSAVSIANELDVNRNTINEDIKFWQMQIASQLEDEDLGGIILKQIERLEIQKKRLLGQLEKSELEQSLRIEKMIFDIDYKITGFVSKIAERKIRIHHESKQEISYEKASEILKKIILSDRINHPECISRESILKEIIFATRCDAEYAHDVFEVLRHMGLEIFPDDDDESYFDLVSFVNAKSVLDTKEREAFKQKLRESKRRKDH